MYEVPQSSLSGIRRRAVIWVGLTTMASIFLLVITWGMVLGEWIMYRGHPGAEREIFILVVLLCALHTLLVVLRGVAGWRGQRPRAIISLLYWILTSVTVWYVDRHWFRVTELPRMLRAIWDNPSGLVNPSLWPDQ